MEAYSQTLESMNEVTVRGHICAANATDSDICIIIMITIARCFIKSNAVWFVADIKQWVLYIPH